MKVNGIGRHVLAEFYDCKADILGDKNKIREILVNAAKIAKFTVVTSHSHYFSPGVTSFVVIGESHLSIHTWPEYNYAAIDIFVCGEKDPWGAYNYIYEKLKPKRVSVIEVKRGFLDQENI